MFLKPWNNINLPLPSTTKKKAYMRQERDLIRVCVGEVLSFSPFATRKNEGKTMEM
jgi:hypothetical protein